MKGGDRSYQMVGIVKDGHASVPTRSTAYTTGVGTGVAGYSTVAGMSHMLGGDPLSFDQQQTEVATQ